MLYLRTERSHKDSVVYAVGWEIWSAWIRVQRNEFVMQPRCTKSFSGLVRKVHTEDCPKYPFHWDGALGTNFILHSAFCFNDRKQATQYWRFACFKMLCKCPPWFDFSSRTREVRAHIDPKIPRGNSIPVRMRAGALVVIKVECKHQANGKCTNPR